MHLRLGFQLVSTSVQNVQMNPDLSEWLLQSVAPLTNQSTSRLELLGALILSRLMKTVKKALQQFTTINSEVYLTDSQVILTWIKTTDKKYKQLVKNRVGEIRQNSNQRKENIANLASRGCNSDTLESTKKWFNGLEWLLYDKEKYQQKI